MIERLIPFLIRSRTMTVPNDDFTSRVTVKPTSEEVKAELNEMSNARLLRRFESMIEMQAQWR